MKIDENIDLNLLFDVITEPKKVLINQKLKGPKLLKQIFSEIISIAQPIDFNLFVIEGDVSDIQKRLTEILDPNQPYTLVGNSKLKDMHEDEKIVIVIEYLNLLAENNGLGFQYHNGKYYAYTGSFWYNCDEASMSEFLKELAIKAGMSSVKTKISRVRDKLIKQFSTTNPHFDSANEKNLKINLLNGTYHFGENQERGLKPFNKSDFFKYQLTFNYDSSAKSPMFEDFLNEVLPDVDCQKILFEFLGYTFLDLKLETVLMLLGSGANGKSVVFDIVTALLGKENISTYSLTELTENQYNRAELDCKFLNYASEIGKIKDFDTYKKLISGEPVTARLPYGKPIQMVDYCKFMFNANNLPTVEQTHAFFRRLIVLPFDVTISPEKRDVNLAKKIIAKELSGIFNLVLEGLERLIQQQGFTKSKVVDLLIRNYQKENDYVEMFVEEEGWIPSKTSKMFAKQFLQLYTKYCDENNVKALQRKNFNARLRNLGFSIVQENQNYFYIYCEKAPEKPGITSDVQKSIDQLFFKPKDNE